MDPNNNEGRFQRILRMLLYLQSGPRFNAAQLASTFNVSRRTIYRDINFLRQAGIAIKFDEDTESYRMPTTYEPLKPTDFDLEALSMLTVAAKLSPLNCISGEGRKIEHALSKLLNLIPVELRTEVTTFLNGFTSRYESKHKKLKDDVVWNVIVEALRNKQQVRLTILDGSDKLQTKLAPYQIIATDDGWLVVGRLSLERSSRSFRIQDILAAELTDDPFQIPRGTRLRNWRSSPLVT